MAIPIVTKEKRPERAPENKDGELIVLSAAQHDPHLADPNDFEILDPIFGVNAPVPSHGQHGRSKSDHAKLLKKSAADRGKSPYRKEAK